MLKHTSFDVYKHYTGFICVEDQGEYIVKGAFNQVNIGKNKEQYVVGIEEGLLDSYLINALVPSGLNLGKLIKIPNTSLIRFTLIQKVSGINKHLAALKDLSTNVDVQEWSILEATPQIMIMGEAYSPYISKLKVLSLTTNSVALNQGLLNRVKETPIEFPVSNRDNEIPSIYGSLV